MGKRWYGNVINRIEEGRSVPEIKEDMDITLYYLSDRECYYVTKVENQKRIQVKKYYVCADHSQPGGMGHQNWMYFKTQKEKHDYLKQYFPETYKDDDEIVEPEPETWVFRYGKWKQEVTYTEDNYCDEKELKSLQKNGYYKRYFDLSGKISFGVRSYYYDWSF